MLKKGEISMATNNKKNYGKNKPENNRVSNVPSFDRNKKNSGPQTKVNGGVFKYVGDVTVGELAKKLNLNSSDIIKFLFMNKKAMVTINQTLSDDLIAEVCINYGYDFQKEEVVDKENFEEFLNKMRLLFAEIDLNIIVYKSEKVHYTTNLTDKFGKVMVWKV